MNWNLHEGQVFVLYPFFVGRVHERLAHNAFVPIGPHNDIGAADLPIFQVNSNSIRVNLCDLRAVLELHSRSKRGIV